MHPPGVVPGFLYSLQAVLVAWWLSARQPYGEGLDDEAVYARQGVDRLAVERNHYGHARWRSLGRWARQIATWWPGQVVFGRTWREQVRGLVIELVARGGDDWLERAARGAAV